MEGNREGIGGERRDEVENFLSWPLREFSRGKRSVSVIKQFRHTWCSGTGVKKVTPCPSAAVPGQGA